MLAAAGTKTIGLTIFNLQQSGDYALSAALSTVIVLVIMIASVVPKMFNQNVNPSNLIKQNERIQEKGLLLHTDGQVYLK